MSSFNIHEEKLVYMIMLVLLGIVGGGWMQQKVMIVMIGLEYWKRIVLMDSWYSHWGK